VLLISSPREISSVVLISSLNSLPHRFSLSKNLAARVLVLVLGYPPPWYFLQPSLSVGTGV
jgi:hypothetical protein